MAIRYEQNKAKYKKLIVHQIYFTNKMHAILFFYCLVMSFPSSLKSLENGKENHEMNKNIS